MSADCKQCTTQKWDRRPAMSCCTEASRAEGDTIMWPPAFKMTLFPGRLYKKRNLPPLVTMSCGSGNHKSSLQRHNDEEFEPISAPGTSASHYGDQGKQGDSAW